MTDTDFIEARKFALQKALEVHYNPSPDESILKTAAKFEEFILRNWYFPPKEKDATQ